MIRALEHFAYRYRVILCWSEDYLPAIIGSAGLLAGCSVDLLVHAHSTPSGELP
jgi:hypothetical protein